MKKPALIVIDMLNDFLERWPPAARESLIRSVNELTSQVREQGEPVIWVRQEFAADLSDAFLDLRSKKIQITMRGTHGCEIAAELNVAPSDAVVIKKRYSAFYGTNLEDILSRLGVDCLILAGINTHACIRTTAIDAYQRDWPVIIASDCVDSYDREHHEISLRYMKGSIAVVLTNSEIAALVAEAKKS